MIGLTSDELRAVHAAFPGRAVVSLDRLRGGSKKGVYRLTLDDDATGIAYVWHADEDYWPDAEDSDPDDPFGHASGPDLFAAAHATLSGIGVRVPRLIMRRGEIALLEDVRGSLEELCRRDPHRAEPVLARLGDTVRTMHRHRRAWYGRPGAGQPTEPVEHVVLRRALGQLAESAARVERIATVRQRIADTLLARHAALAPRTEYGLIHGELGPDHVHVDAADQPVLIDIEGIMFFDVEWEHAFLELRFGANYQHFHTGGLDPARLRFYRLAMYLSLVAGPLRLLDGDFPGRAGMTDIVAENIARTLAELP
ncbi:MAG TPA: phosphotransferase [Pseudonocardiaceae bacterium]